MKAILLGALAVLTVTTAAAQNAKSTAEVLPYCKLDPKKAAASDTSAHEYGWCRGAIDGLVVGSWRKHDLSNPGCFDVPEKAFTAGQPFKVVIRYIDRHPGELAEPFLRVAARALHEAWPCRK